jgi:hypothetical protein
MDFERKCTAPDDDDNTQRSKSCGRCNKRRHASIRKGANGLIRAYIRERTTVKHT